MKSNHQRRCRNSLIHLLADMAPPAIDCVAKISIDTRIAIAACEAETKASLALGASYFVAYNSGYRVLDEVLDLARAPMPADTLTRFQPQRTTA